MSIQKPVVTAEDICWAYAPEWANYAAMDGAPDGDVENNWWWFQELPEYDEDCKSWLVAEGTPHDFFNERGPDVALEFASLTLVERPKDM